MKRTMMVALATAALVLVPQDSQAQDSEKSMAVKGGILVKGWMGKVDAKEAKAGLSVDSAKFFSMAKDLHATTGPAITYWNPEMKGKGDYVVKATFTEREYMGLNYHPHPYGVVLAGNGFGL